MFAEMGNNEHTEMSFQLLDLPYPFIFETVFTVRGNGRNHSAVKLAVTT